MKRYKYCVLLLQHTKSEIIPHEFDKNFGFRILIENLTFGMNSLATILYTYMTDLGSLFMCSVQFTVITQHPPDLWPCSYWRKQRLTLLPKNHFLLLLLCARTIMEAWWIVSGNEYEWRPYRRKLFIHHYSTQLFYSYYKHGLKRKVSRIIRNFINCRIWRRSLWMLPPFGIWRPVVRMWTDVSEELITSISRVENQLGSLRNNHGPNRLGASLHMPEHRNRSSLRNVAFSS
jgi:hypothetical protein